MNYTEDTVGVTDIYRHYFILEIMTEPFPKAYKVYALGISRWAPEVNQLTGIDGKSSRIRADANFKRLRFSNT